MPERMGKLHIQSITMDKTKSKAVTVYPLLFFKHSLLSIWEGVYVYSHTQIQMRKKCTYIQAHRFNYTDSQIYRQRQQGVCIFIFQLIQTQSYVYRHVHERSPFPLLLLLEKNQWLLLTPISTVLFDMDSFDFLAHHKPYCRPCKQLGYATPSLRTHAVANLDDWSKEMIKMR